MNCVLSVKIFLFSIFIEQVFGEACYEAKFTESINACKDFKNEHIEAEDIKLGMKECEGDEEPLFGLSGPIIMHTALDDDVNVNLNIFKSTELGEEYMFKSAINFCQSMKDEDAPWFPILQEMNLTGCPVKKGIYPIEDMMLSIDAFSDLLCRDFCGEYTVELSLAKEIDNVIACFLVGVGIYEYECDE